MEASGFLRIGVDIGGTFTDFMIFDPASGTLSSFKVPSTPTKPERAVLAGLERISPGSNFTITHGSTVATNALLERKGARTALITTKGFRDVLAIGRQNRPVLYDLFPKIPPPLVPDDLRFEVNERIDSGGNILIPLGFQEIQSTIKDLPPDIESIAICLLFSFLHPDHEQTIARELRSAEYFVSASQEILPEYREYERTATTVVNAYVSPIMDRYLTRLEEALKSNRPEPFDKAQDKRSESVAPRTLSIMQSNGGIISPDQARHEAVRCILSGPAGGLVAAQNISITLVAPDTNALSEQSHFLTFDMGGTSTDVSLIKGEPRVTTEAEIGGLPIRVPILDIHTIGAGGGSIAHIDPGGGLRVGPSSAGADPGPACYGGSGAGPRLATVTDANLLLGRLHPDHFLGGQMPLYPDFSRTAIQPLAEQLGLSPEQVSLGIIQIANAHMARALRVISVERGHDPRDFTLVSFGGAGGLHAADLARELAIPRVLVPRHASTFSALGMLLADVVKDYALTIMLPGHSTFETLKSKIHPLLAKAREDLLAEGISNDHIKLEPQLDVRFRGQSYDLNVPFSKDWKTAFHDLYRSTYGFAPLEGDLEIVNVRVRARGGVPSPVLDPHPFIGSDPAPAAMGVRDVWFRDGVGTIDMFDGAKLAPGNMISGPALVIRSDTTILLGPNDSAEVDEYLNLLIEVN